mmetsp:Transcript_20598/g.63687  ORF Transcript_20598/g.63687 Transcript_20598/m.63687 type:complete len:226 (+) Transcript_20598:196-873(+)
MMIPHDDRSVRLLPEGEGASLVGGGEEAARGGGGEVDGGQRRGGATTTRSRTGSTTRRRRSRENGVAEAGGDVEDEGVAGGGGHGDVAAVLGEGRAEGVGGVRDLKGLGLSEERDAAARPVVVDVDRGVAAEGDDEVRLPAAPREAEDGGVARNLGHGVCPPAQIPRPHDAVAMARIQALGAAVAEAVAGRGGAQTTGEDEAEVPDLDGAIDGPARGELRREHRR